MLRIDAKDTKLEFSAGVTPGITASPLEVVRVEIGEGLTGPIAVSGAEPGDVVRIELRRVKHASRGRIVTFGSLIGSAEAPASFPVAIEDGLVQLPGGFTCAARPFVASIGTAPAGESVEWSLPGEHGGFLGCRRLRTQSRVYLPCAVTGALLSLGGLRAAVGDGAVTGPGVAVKGSVDLAAQVLKGLELPLPLAVEAGTVMAFGWGGALQQAVLEAGRRAIDLVRTVSGAGATEAALFVGTAGQVRVCRVDCQGAVARVEMPLCFFAERGVIL